MEDQEIDKQLKSQNLKGKIALILGVINLILLLLSLAGLSLIWHYYEYPYSLYFRGEEPPFLRTRRSFSYCTFLGGALGTLLVAVAGIIFGFLGWKTTKGKIGIILCVVGLLVSGYFLIMFYISTAFGY
jgi:hypothetical protein